MSKYSIRPHHMLCLQFFEGKGYSDDFVENMMAIKKRLETENPLVHITKGADDICANCPNCVGDACNKEQEILKHDARVYEQVQANLNNPETWHTITRIIYQNIINAGIMKTVCGECKWSDICFREE